MIRRPPISTLTDTLFPYTTLFRSFAVDIDRPKADGGDRVQRNRARQPRRDCANHLIDEAVDHGWRGRQVLALRDRSQVIKQRAGRIEKLARTAQLGAWHDPARSRSEERRVGQAWVRRGRLRGPPYTNKKKTEK